MARWGFNAVRTIGVLAISLGGAAWSSYALAKTRALYFCAKYDAQIVYGYDFGDFVHKNFGREFALAEDSLYYDRSGSSKGKTSDCSNKDMLCLEEESVAPNSISREKFIYVVPRRIEFRRRYSANGVRFHIDHIGGELAGRRNAMVIAEMGPVDKPVRYKLYLEQGIGVKEIYYEKLHGTSMGSYEFDQEYAGVSCSLASRLGLFSDVKIPMPPRKKSPYVDLPPIK